MALKDKAKRALCDPALLQARDEHFARLKMLFAGERLDRPFFLYGCVGVGKSDVYREPEAWLEETLCDLAPNVGLLRDSVVFRPLVVEAGLYGVHFIDRILGAEVYDLGGGNWQVRCLETPIGELRPPDLDADETWGLARRLAKAFTGDDVTVPLFGLPTIAGALNIALNLYGERILLAMYAASASARRDLSTINDLLCRLHRWYLANIPAAQMQPVVAAFRTQPPGFGQICGCSTQLLSPELYRDFIAPLDDELLSVYPHGGMIHLCGSHTQHIPIWRGMRSLRAVQLNDRAALDLEVYFRELREDQILYANPCGGMPVERILEITGGRRVVIIAENQQGF